MSADSLTFTALLCVQLTINILLSLGQWDGQQLDPATQTETSTCAHLSIYLSLSPCI
jgi:hypothetical protein